jgi:hypothetical protein
MPIIVAVPQVSPFGFVWAQSDSGGSIGGSKRLRDDDDFELLTVLGVL